MDNNRYTLLVKRTPYKSEWETRAIGNDREFLETLADYHVRVPGAAKVGEHCFAACLLDMEWEKPVTLVWEYWSEATQLNCSCEMCMAENAELSA